MAVTNNTCAADRGLLLGCGILKRELAFLVKKNGWALDLFMLDSSLHTNFGKLERGLTGALAKHADQQTVVFYGCCHPQMEQILHNAHTHRTEGQNCVEMLLGRELFMQELSAGAFFLIEDWALRWDEVIFETFGRNEQIIREIFHDAHRSLLALRTPCSTDFSEQAEAIATRLALPLRWHDVPLDHLELVVVEAMGINN